MPEHSTIRVRFIEAETGQLLGESEVPAEQLPQSFEAATSLDIGESSFEVVSADPMTAQEFRQTGALRLELREVKYAMVDPRELLYSLPTISNELPPIEEAALKGDARLLAALASKHQLCLVDWCRVEQVPASAERIQAWLSGQD